jgi:hypothetical protein
MPISTEEVFYFDQLLQRKFSAGRGYKSRAAEALKLKSANLSAMLNGRTTIPKKYIDALLALPDHKPKSGAWYEYDPTIKSMIEFMTFKLTPESKRSIELLARANTLEYAMPNFASFGEDIVATFFERMLKIAEDNLDGATRAKVLDAIERDRIEAREALKNETKSLRHLVADELNTKPQDDEDPLS